jgi:hypothetical protein
VLVAASAAFACTVVVGTLKISGSTSATASAGGTVSSITVASLPGYGGTTRNIVATKVDRFRYCMTYTNTLATGVAVQTATTPNLGPVNGTAPSITGTYDVCAVDYSNGRSDSTNPATLTVN